ncbi:protein LIFEGUARD 4-like [Rosa rugosa]|uniref:protein LIFEGUARD 4-like n=1 Tax=Rosa rugosa TaxID=74645 RepID=UPI002B40A433|nr:protein LIFEGUARD 4-like [Rosa rugosa]
MTPKIDLEVGEILRHRRLYPSMVDSPELRWAFIRKVYAIPTVQFLLTIAVAATVDLVRPIAYFLVKTLAGLLSISPAVFIIALAYIISLIRLFFFEVLVALLFYATKHPVNNLLIGLFTICLGLMVGVVGHLMNWKTEKVILEAWGLTTMIFISLTLYTFWAARRGHDFGFLGPFLFADLVVLLGFGLIQLSSSFYFSPCGMGKISRMIYGIVGCIIFCYYIVYDTDKLIKRHHYDDYMLAAIELYLDAIYLFSSMIAASDS